MLPDFVILGTQKGGTTSLYNYLLRHPRVVRAARKEVHFFDFHYAKGVEWYKQQFPLRPFEQVGHPKCIRGEASPYYLVHPHAPRRLAQLLPDVRLIILLRNPMDRAYAHYHHQVRAGIETAGTFEAAIELEAERLAGEWERLMAEEDYYSYPHHQFSYLARGVYIEQVRQWDALFHRDQMLILKSEDFYRLPRQTLERVGRFLGVAEVDWGSRFPPQNAGSYAEINSATRRRLLDFYASHNEELEDYFHEKFSWT